MLTVKYPDIVGYDINGAGPQNLPGRVYTYAYDGLGRPIGLTDNQQTPLSWVNNVQYGPASELKQMTYSLAAAYADDAKDLYSIGSVTETQVYNSRLQLTSLTAGTFSAQYQYSATQNNGQIMSAEGVQYTYDSLNRLIAAATTDPT